MTVIYLIRRSTLVQNTDPEAEESDTTGDAQRTDAGKSEEKANPANHSPKSA